MGVSVVAPMASRH